MKENQKALLFALALLLIGILLHRFTKSKAPEVPNEIAEDPPNEDFYAPYYWPTPGVYPESSPFESTVSVFIDANPINSLSQQYIPMFGLVGMTAVGMG